MQEALDKGKRNAEGSMTFREAAARHLREATKRSLVRDVYALEKLVPVIGHLTLEEIHQGTLQPYIERRRQEGIKSATITRELTVVRRILTLAARVWRNAHNRPFLNVVPLLTMPQWEDEAVPYPLSWDEQKRFFGAMPAYLARMALFAVNTGLREQGICWLRWEWERALPELDTSVFVIPGRPIPYPDGTWPGEKNKEDQLVVLNSVARAVVDAGRGNGSPYVFAYQGRRLDRMYNTAWRNAGLPTDARFCRGPHNLKHTFGRRLRAAEVRLETRKVLLHHTTGDITIHYSPADIRELLTAVEKLTEQRPVTLLKQVVG